MKVKVVTDDTLKEIEVVINCPERDEQVDRIVKAIETSLFNIMGKLRGENYVLNIDDIYYFEAVENKVFAYLETQVYEVEYKIAELNDLLKSTSFIQIARTVVLNLDKIKKIKTMVNGRILAELNNEEKIIITRVYANEFKKKMLNVDSGIQKGMAENEDIYFQSVEARNELYNVMPDIVNEYINKGYFYTNSN